MPVKWEDRIVSPEEVISKIKPGMSIFLGTGVAEPRTLIRYLMASEAHNLVDLELVQLVSLGEAIPIDESYAQKYRLKTFFSGWVASEAITAGWMDLIPCRFSRIPELFRRGIVRIDAAFVQITPPDRQGISSLGVSVDVARYAMEQASLVVGVLNDKIPFTLGDTLVNADEFDFFVVSTDPPFYFPKWPDDEIFSKVAANVASVIEDGSCLSFFAGTLFEELGKSLVRKRDLSVHSLMMTDTVMNLMKSGAVTNRRKKYFKGKTVVSYAQGTPELMDWLNRNPAIEFQGLDVCGDPKYIGYNDKFVGVIPARKVDLSGRVALHIGKGSIAIGPGETAELFAGAALSKGGKTIFALPSRNLKGRPNILLSIEDYPNQFNDTISLDMIATEYGIAYLNGRTVRERAIALIDIAHPDDRGDLAKSAREANIVFQDQIYLSESGHLYPGDIDYSHTFKNNMTVRFRPIKPSDEDDMRRLFYRFSDKTVYYRYFSPIKTMPHKKMQEYVNIDYDRTISIVGILDEDGVKRIIAEGRFVKYDEGKSADVAFIVDEKYQGTGVGTYLFELLVKTAKTRGVNFFTADVLTDNKSMMKVFEKNQYPLRAVVEGGIYSVTIPFSGEGKT